MHGVSAACRRLSIRGMGIESAGATTYWAHGMSIPASENANYMGLIHLVSRDVDGAICDGLWLGQ